MLRKIDLNMYLPQVIGDAKEIRAIMDTENIEFNKVWQVMEKIHNNQFILTADEKTLSWYEKVLLITPKGDIEKRRTKVLIEWNRKVLYTDRGLREILDELISKHKYKMTINYNKYDFEFKLHFEDGDMDEYELYDLLRVIIPANLTISMEVVFYKKVNITTYYADNIYPFPIAGDVFGDDLIDLENIIDEHKTVIKIHNTEITTEDSPMYAGDPTILLEEDFDRKPNKEILFDKIQEGEAVNLDNYKEESVARFKEALNKCIEVYKDEKVTQKDINNVIKEFDLAYSNLAVEKKI